jgi:hypothetical protein
VNQFTSAEIKKKTARQSILLFYIICCFVIYIHIELQYNKIAIFVWKKSKKNPLNNDDSNGIKRFVSVVTTNVYQARTYIIGKQKSF